MNHQIFYAINNFAGHWPILDSFGVYLAGNIFFAYWVGILFFIWLKYFNLRNYIYLAIGAALISRLVIVEIIKRVVNNPRPYEILANINQLFADNETGKSFPSGHAVIFFSIAFAFWGTKYFWPFVVLATLGSIARIFVGVHFPLDILTSVLIAGLTVWILKLFFARKFAN